MHYYPFNLKDYLFETAHLPPMADLAYRRLLDLYYKEEAPIPNKPKWVANRIRLDSEETVIGFVLRTYFKLDGAGTAAVWRHDRADKEIAKYQKKVAVARENGQQHTAGTKRHPKSDADGKLTKNHKPRTNIVPLDAATTRGTRFAAESQAPEAWLAYCKAERPELDASKTFEMFRDYWVAKAGKDGLKLDWLATWRNWVKSQSLRPGVAAKDDKPLDPLKTKEGIMALAADIGHEPYDETRAFPDYQASVLRAAGKIRGPAVGLEELAGSAVRRMN